MGKHIVFILESKLYSSILSVFIASAKLSDLPQSFYATPFFTTYLYCKPFFVNLIFGNIFVRSWFPWVLNNFYLSIISLECRWHGLCVAPCARYEQEVSSRYFETCPRNGFYHPFFGTDVFANLFCKTFLQHLPFSPMFYFLSSCRFWVTVIIGTADEGGV